MFKAINYPVVYYDFDLSGNAMVGRDQLVSFTLPIKESCRAINNKVTNQVYKDFFED